MAMVPPASFAPPVGSLSTNSVSTWLRNISHEAKNLIELLERAKLQGEGVTGASDEAFREAIDYMVYRYSRDAAEISGWLQQILDWRDSHPDDAVRYGNLPEQLRNAWEDVQHCWLADDAWTRGNIAGTAGAIIPSLRRMVWIQVYVTGPSTVNDHLVKMNHGDTLELKDVLSDEVVDDSMLVEIGQAFRRFPREFAGSFIDNTTLVKVDRSASTRFLNIGLVVAAALVPVLIGLVLGIVDRNTDLSSASLDNFMDKPGYFWLTGYMVIALAGATAHMAIKFIKAKNIRTVTGAGVADWISIRSGTMIASILTVWVVLFLPPILSIAGIEEFRLTFLTAFLSGYAADSLFANLTDRFDTEVDTLTASLLKKPQAAGAGA